MLIHLHKQATTTPKVRAAIQASDEVGTVLAERFGVTPQTIYKWRKRDSIEDSSLTPHRLQTTLTQAQEAVAATQIDVGRWLSFFFDSDTTGEKPFEEFFRAHEAVDMDHFNLSGIVRNDLAFDPAQHENFVPKINAMKGRGQWDRSELAAIFHEMLSDFAHAEAGQFLDDRM